MAHAHAHVSPPTAGTASGLRQLLADYAALTKPKVQLLLIFTTATTML